MRGSFENIVKKKIDNISSEAPEGLFHTLMETRKVGQLSYLRRISRNWAVAIVGLGVLGLSVLTYQTLNRTNVEDVVGLNAISGQQVDDRGVENIGRDVTKNEASILVESDAEYRGSGNSEQNENSTSHSVTGSNMDKDKMVHTPISERSASAGKLQFIEIADGFTTDDHISNNVLNVKPEAGGEQISEPHSLLLRPLHRVDMSERTIKIKDSEMAQLPEMALSRSMDPKRMYFVDLMYVPGVAKNHSLNKNTDYGDLVNGLMRNNYINGFNLRVSTPLNNNIRIFAGIGTLYFDDVVKGGIDRVEKVQKITSTTTYINDPVTGTRPVTTYDTGMVHEVKTDDVYFENRFSLFQLPVGLSYGRTYGRFELSFNGALSANILRVTGGDVIDTENKQVTETEYSGKYTGLGVYGGLNINYKLSNRLGVFAEPNISYIYFANMKHSFEGANRLRINGISLGLRYRLR